ncbi:hypothetical protein [Micromonospora sp. NPDC047187]|uniref:hypothetical protein n=1 Tax=Micromonospora sp. NPDC047187 TaxID=3155262 RepID=UPI0033C6BE64
MPGSRQRVVESSRTGWPAGKRVTAPNGSDDRAGVQVGRESMSESGQQREPDRNVDSGNPDVLLDIPKVSVDSIRLEVDGLEADLSLRARVANLLQVDAGVRVHLNGGELNIDGVNAEAQLRVRLEQLTRILGRALDTLDHNPHIIEALAGTAGTAVDDVNRSAQQLAAGAAEIKASSRRLGSDRPDAGRSGAGPVGSGPGAGGPGPRAGGPGLADQAQPQGQQPQGRRPQGQHPGSAGPTAGQTGNKPGQSAASGPSPSGDGDGGLPGAAQAAAQNAAQFAEQAGETLREAGRSVWEAIQGSVAQHRPQGRRDH